MKFRFHRGLLADSMETVVEVGSKGQLKRIVAQVYGETGTLTFEHIGFDERIGWDTWYVLLDGHCVGMSDGEL